MSQKTKSRTSIKNAIKEAIRDFDESRDRSFDDMRKYLMSYYQGNGMSILDTTSVKPCLQNTAENGTLLKLDNGNYKTKESARYRDSSRSRTRNKSGNRSRPVSTKVRLSLSSRDGSRKLRSDSKKRVRPNNTKIAMGSENASLPKTRRKCSPSPGSLKKLDNGNYKTKESRHRGSSRSRSRKKSGNRSRSISAKVLLPLSSRDGSRKLRSDSEKHVRTNNAKQATGSKNMSLPKTKRKRSPSPGLLKENQRNRNTDQVPLPKKTARMPRRVDRRKTKKGSDISLSDYMDESDYENPDVKEYGYFS